MAQILLVEDEPLVAETLSTAIKSKGHSCLIATDGIEGLKMFGEDHFDLVVTDIIMPSKEGIELIIEMRRQMPTAKIVAISGGGRTGGGEFLKIAKDMGAMAVLEKPVHLSDFFRVLSDCLAAKSAQDGRSQPG